MSFDKNPEKVAFTPPPGMFAPDDPNPRAAGATKEAPGPPFTMPVAFLHRVLPPKERPGEICGTCAKKDRRVAVERLPSGEPTGLCAHHNRFEKERRRELKMASDLGPLTAEKASEIYKSVARSMHLGDVGGEEDYVPAGHDRAWDPS
jgi:hypothetical protein